MAKGIVPPRHGLREAPCCAAEPTVGGRLVLEPTAYRSPDAGSRGRSMTTSYRPGAVSRFLAWIDTLPGHGWWIFPALGVLLFAWAHGILWATGRRPAGTIEPVITVGVAYGPYSLAVLALVNRVARRSLAAFWPATGLPDSERATWAYQFVNSPGGYGWVSIFVGVPLALGSFLSAPASVLGAESGRAALFIAYLPSLLFGYSMLPAAVFATVRELRLVARIHREATAIDPFDREPVYAFSRLTVLTGLAYVLVGYYTVSVNGAFQVGNVVSLTAVGLSVVVGVAAFVLPLWGIHDRLVFEKGHLLRQVEGRLNRLGTEMYRRIDAGEFDSTKVISDSLAGVTALRERIARLPTWPWPPQLLRGFVSALLLPVVVYLLTRVISTQLAS